MKSFHISTVDYNDAGTAVLRLHLGPNSIGIDFNILAITEQWSKHSASLPKDLQK